MKSVLDYSQVDNFHKGSVAPIRQLERERDLANGVSSNEELSEVLQWLQVLPDTPSLEGGNSGRHPSFRRGKSPGSLNSLISQKVFIYKSQYLHKSVNLSFIITNTKNKLTNLRRN